MKSKRNKRASVETDQNISAGSRGVSDEEWARLSAGDPDASPQGTDSGEETPGGTTPTPDQDMVDEIGEAVGATYQEDVPLKFGEKYAGRDDARWENDPASSEDYVERQAALESESDRLRPRNAPNGGASSEDAASEDA